MAEKEPGGFVYYRSFHEATKELPPEIYKELNMAIIEYALEDKEPAKLSPFAQMGYSLIKPQLDANKERWKNGCKGGRPSTKKPNQNETKKQPKEKEKEKEKEKNIYYRQKNNLKTTSSFCCNDEAHNYDLRTLEEILTS